MKRILPWILLAGLSLAGCSRSADPLEWKIEGRHLGDLQNSLDEILDALPKDLGQEFVFCFNNVKADVLLDRSGTVQDQENRICRRLRDRTVLSILIEGNELAQHAIAIRLDSETNYLLRLANEGDQFTGQWQQSYAQRLEAAHARVDQLKQMLEKSQHRLAGLRAKAAGK